MAMSAVYTNFGGKLVHEDRGGTERQYVRDPLGSLIGEIDSDQELTYSAEYWPYGEEHSTVGLRQSDWGFVGLFGYLKDLVNLLYVRARHYLPNQARWLVVDQLWPRESAFSYARNSPSVFIDPTGLNACKVYICSVDSSKWKHQFICVEGPNRGCSLGMYHDGPDDKGYGNVCAQPGLTTCKLISNDCAYASEVCACTRRYRQRDRGLWDYIKVGTCFGFTSLMACCGCGKDRNCLLRLRCISNSCGSIYDGLPEVGRHDQCPPGYRKRSGGGWVVG